MKALIYELFSGVGFCNQLFSLETAIYLANITNRKLILMIRFPLCHIGQSSWEYGNFLDFFNNDYLDFLPNGIETHYGMAPSHIKEIIDNKSICDTVNFINIFSQIGIIDVKLDTPENEDDIKAFLNHRKKCVIDFDSYTKEYMYINKSNAARCFYNFYTTKDNYFTMSRICQSLTHLQPCFYDIIKKIDLLPKNYLAIHFRFGDRKYTKRDIDRNSNRFGVPLFKLLGELNSGNLPIVIMCDRRDAELLVRLKSNFDVIFISDLIQDLNLNDNFKNFKRTELINFLIQKNICDNADYFIGHDGSTVSNYINYMHYLNDKPYYYYLDKVLKYNYIDHTWKLNGYVGGNISFRVFFADNVSKHNLKLITLTNDGYMKFTENLLISMKKLGIETKLKIYCIGEKSFKFFSDNYSKNELEQIDTNEDFLKSWVEYKACQNPDEEGKKKWASITSYKMYAIHNELIQGNDIIFTDGDIVFERDPITYMMEKIKDNDLLIQNDSHTITKKCMCTGIMYMRSNDYTREITNFENINENIDKFTNDQQYLRRYEKSMKVEYLDLNLFPNGLYYRRNKPTSAYMIHFNYDVAEQKIKRMKSFNKWYVNEPNNISQLPPPKLISTSNTVNKSDTKSKLYENEIYITDSSLTKYIETSGHKIRQGYITEIKKHEDTIINVLNINTYDAINVLEIGFLAGHSAEMFLKLNNKIKVTSIDISSFQSVDCGKKYIDKNYPNRHRLIKGNSCEVLKKLISTEKTKFDIILIDGSYEEDVVYSDIMFCKNLAHRRTKLIINNAILKENLIRYWNKGPTTASNKLISSSIIQNAKFYDIDIGKGSVICEYKI